MESRTVVNKSSVKIDTFDFFELTKTKLLKTATILNKYEKYSYKDSTIHHLRTARMRDRRNRSSSFLIQPHKVEDCWIRHFNVSIPGFKKGSLTIIKDRTRHTLTLKYGSVVGLGLIIGWILYEYNGGGQLNELISEYGFALALFSIYGLYTFYKKYFSKNKKRITKHRIRNSTFESKYDVYTSHDHLIKQCTERRQRLLLQRKENNPDIVLELLVTKQGIITKLSYSPRWYIFSFKSQSTVKQLILDTQGAVEEFVQAFQGDDNYFASSGGSID